MKEKKPTLKERVETQAQRLTDLCNRNDALVKRVAELTQAVYPFRFPSSPQDFRGIDTSMTKCIVNDVDVQRVRYLFPL
jgi:hypothetical protein